MAAQTLTAQQIVVSNPAPQRADAAPTNLKVRPREPSASENWREDLQNIASRRWSMTLRHPWMVELPAFRSSFGSDSLRWLEFSLKVIDAVGSIPTKCW